MIRHDTLPKGWKRSDLGSISNVVRGSSPRPAGDPRYFNGSFLPWITVADVTRVPGIYLTSTQSFLTEEGSKYTRIIEPDTLLLTNSGATLGVPKICKIKAGANDGIAMLLDIKEAHIFYIYYILESLTRHFREQLAPGVGQPNLNTDLIGNVPILLPPLEEQVKIASLLSFCDEYIVQLEKCMESKREHKRALMQRLLTGKLRFPEFVGQPWNHVQLAQIASIIKKTPLLSVDGETLLTVKLYCKGIERNERITARLSEKGRPYYKRYAGEFIIGRQNFHNGGFAILPSEMDGLIASSAITSVQIDAKKALDKFIFYYLSREEYYLKAGDRIGGTGQKEFSDKELLALPINLPSLPEQRKIAAVLSTADREIDQLTQKLDAYKQQKKGLMQQLLTGKKRVKLSKDKENINAA